MKPTKTFKQKDIDKMLRSIYLFVIIPMFILLLLNAWVITFYSKVIGIVFISLNIIISYILLKKIGFI